MYKRFIATLCLLVISQASFADSCPSVKDIQTKSLTGWKIYDSVDNKLPPATRIAELKQFAAQFALAEWTSKDKKTGSIHCYYRDNEGSVLESYLSKDNFKPTNSKNFWYEASDALHCAAGSEKCEFTNTDVAAQQLAAK